MTRGFGVSWSSGLVEPARIWSDINRMGSADTSIDIDALRDCRRNGRRQSRSLRNKLAIVFCLSIPHLLALSLLLAVVASFSAERQVLEQGVPKEKTQENSQGDQDGHTPLHVAAAAGDLASMKRLLLDHVSPNTRSRFGGTPLHCAAYAGKVDAVKLLLDQGAACNVQNDFGETPLHLAADKDQLEVVDLLLRLGADVNLTNEIGETPLDYARAGTRCGNLLARQGAKFSNRPSR